MTQKQNSSHSVWKRIDIIILVVILLIAASFRMYKLKDVPLTDWHSWRQADTAAVARNFVKDGFDLLHPKYDDLSKTQSGMYNPQGYRFVEFPVYNSIFAFFTRYLPIFSLETYGRITTMLFSLLLIGIIYYLLFKEEGRLAATFGALTFAIMPFFVYYSRVILPDMTAITFIFISIAFLYLIPDQPKKTPIILMLLGAIFAALALLTKPTTIFFLIPIIYLFFKKFGISTFKKFPIYLFFFITLTPLIAWRFWIHQFPEGIPGSEWLLTSVNTAQGLQVVFFKPAFFRWIFNERILNLILGGFLIIPFVLGMIKKPRRSALFYMIGIASLLYLFVFQGGNVQHDYYQILILPALAIFSGIGISYLFNDKKLFSSVIFNIIIVFIIILASFTSSYYQVKNYYSYNYDYVGIANIIKSITSPDERIITDTSGDTTLLYLSERKGFPAITGSLEDLHKMGAQYLVTFNKDYLTNLKDIYPLVFQTEKVYIFSLNPQIEK